MANKSKLNPGNAKPAPFALIEDELSKVEDVLRSQVRDFDPGVEPYVSYTVSYTHLTLPTNREV